MDRSLLRTFQIRLEQQHRGTTETKRILLDQEELPTSGYNIQADLPEQPPPPLHPGIKQPGGLEEVAPLFPMALIQQEVSQDWWVEIAAEIRRVLSAWRPALLVRARNLEKALKTPARICFKDYSHCPPGSHKRNTAVAPDYYNNLEGVRRLVTDTGAGQWGSALAFAMFELERKLFTVKVGYEQKPYRRSMMKLCNASVTPSPSPATEAGRQVLDADSDSLGSLGVAASEAVEVAVKNDDTRYSIGSVLNHVLLDQTVIGLEAKGSSS